MLLACFRSEQMSFAQLEAHMDGDPGFWHYVEEQLEIGKTRPTIFVRSAPEFADH